MTNGRHIREEDLQLLAAGALPEAERAAVQAHAAGCAECAAKLAEQQGVAAALAFAAEQEKPAATIKAELLARIRAERQSEERSRWTVQRDMEAVAEDTKEMPQAVEGAKTGWWSWVLVPVAALLVVAVMEWRENRRLSAELENTNHQIMAMAIERQHSEMLLDVLSAQDTLSVKMAGMPEAEKATGMVKYNARKGVVLYTAVLPPLPADKIYQMWLVPTAGAPISAGIFSPKAQELRRWWTAQVPVNTGAKAFAVTIEPAGGGAQPTGPKVLLGAS